jgi:exo-beta-1,3-glucanase (GH17 family)
LLLSLHLDTFMKDPGRQEGIVRELLRLSDYVAVSTYPYTEQAHPAKLAPDWFSRLRELASEKPFAVTETGFPAENVVLTQYRVRIPGREQWQADYVRRLLSEAHRLQAQFVVWFVLRDYDAGWETLTQMGGDDLLKLWRDTGLLDGNGQARSGLRIWDAWLALPRS